MAIAMAAAARGIVVTPAQLGLAGAPGSTVSGIVKVSSSQIEEARVEAAIGDFTRDEDGKIHELRHDQATRSCAGWLDLDKTEFTAPGGTSEEITVIAKIPKEASGSYWAILGLSVPPSSRAGKGPGVQIVPRIAIPVVITVSGTDQRVVVARPPFSISVAEGGLQCLLMVENTGNAAVLISGAFALEKTTGKPAETEEVASVDVGPLTCLPGLKLRVKGKIPYVGPTGALMAHAYLRYGPEVGEALEAEASLEGLPPIPPAPPGSPTASPQSPPPAVGGNGPLAPPAPAPSAKESTPAEPKKP